MYPPQQGKWKSLKTGVYEVVTGTKFQCNDVITMTEGRQCLGRECNWQKISLFFLWQLVLYLVVKKIKKGAIVRGLWNLIYYKYVANKMDVVVAN